MYHYFDEKVALYQMRAFSGELMQTLCHRLKVDHDIGANFCLIGSGAKNLILQNEKEPVDLDYNLKIVRCVDFNDCRYLKECARKSFNKCLALYGLQNCEDSTSALTSKLIPLRSNHRTSFSIDICIIRRGPGSDYSRLIHEKTGWTSADRYYWNPAPQSIDLNRKTAYIKEHGKWELVRQQYLRIKNNYLTSNALAHHPSFICYLEAVNHAYNQIRTANGPADMSHQKHVAVTIPF